MYMRNPNRKVSLATTRKRLAVLAGAGLVLGGVGGIAADTVVHLVGLITNLALLHRFGWELPDLRHYHPTPVLLAVAVAGALVVVAVARWSPIIKGHGIPESLEAILFRDSRVNPRAALVPLVLATSVASSLHYVLLEPRPLFAVAHPLVLQVDLLPLFAVVGVAAGVAAVVLNRGLFAVEAGFRHLPIPEWTHPIVGAVGFAAIGLAVPGSLSVGYWAITDAVNDRFVLGAAAVLCVAKMVSWWIGLGSNTSGGTLAPMFLVGATMGDMIGIGFAHAFPAAHIQPGAFALVGMGATFGVGARALLTGVVFAAEVTGGYSMLVPLLLATGVAELVAEFVLDDRIMTDKLRRRGYRVDFDTQTGPLRMRVAGQVMIPFDEPTAADYALATVDRWAYLSDALPLLLDPHTPSVVVTDQGRAVGTITRDQLDAELRRRLADDRIQAPTLGPWAARLHKRYTKTTELDAGPPCGPATTGPADTTRTPSSPPLRRHWRIVTSTIRHLPTPTHRHSPPD